MSIHSTSAFKERSYDPGVESDQFVSAALTSKAISRSHKTAAAFTSTPEHSTSEAGMGSEGRDAIDPSRPVGIRFKFAPN
jgi:hypothetical protein